MTTSEINRAIAEWMGWTQIEESCPYHMNQMAGIPLQTTHPYKELVPNFQGDLNAVTKAELWLDTEDRLRPPLKAYCS